MSLENLIISSPSDPSARQQHLAPAQRIRAFARDGVHGTLRRIVTARGALPVANTLYRLSSARMRERLQRRFAKIFRGRPSPRGATGRWIVSFGGRRIVHPLEPSRMWLDWDLALSTLGHEPNVKRTYETLLASPDRPTLFMDVGANYGTHSLIFLVHGVETLTFEPNASCHEYFREVCALNGVTPRLEAVALGERAGEVTLSYPEGETWLGSIDGGTIARLGHETKLVHARVPVRPLDDYIDIAVGKRVIIKIDAEGHEVPILRGASRMLSTIRPSVIFESWARAAEERRTLWALFSGVGYRIARLPLASSRPPQFLNEGDFQADGANDFIALPA